MQTLSLFRLLQLGSANLPVGGFTYSQGLEWAVEAKWVTDYAQTKSWLEMQMHSTLAYCDFPILQRLYYSCVDRQFNDFKRWTIHLLSQRETHELRLEEQQRGGAFLRFLQGLDFQTDWDDVIKQSQLSGLAWYAANQALSVTELQTCWGYSWLESNVMAAMKLVPLGQQSGQQLIYDLSSQFTGLIEQANQLPDDELGAGAPFVSIASSCHETQYTRLFRS